MSYSSQAALSRDIDFMSRISACAAVEVGAPTDPNEWAKTNVAFIAAAPGFAAAYESAQAGNVERPGNDPAVISDAQILSAVQALLGAA